jgi:hypothetical protein
MVESSIEARRNDCASAAFTNGRMWGGREHHEISQVATDDLMSFTGCGEFASFERTNVATQ